MRKRFLPAVSLAVCVTMGICACSSDNDEDVFTGDTPEEPEYQANLDAVTPAAYSTVDGLDLEPGTYISVIGKQEDSSYWQQIRAGVQQAAADLNEKLGYSGNDQIRVLFNAPSDGEDIDEQVNILDEELARYPDVIAIASIDADASEVQFDLAIGNGIPIVAFDSGNSYQGIQCTCVTDNRTAAAEGASRLCGAVEESGEVLLLVHDSVSGNAAERMEGFTGEITGNHPGVTLAGPLYLDQLNEIKRQAAAEQLNVSLEELQAAEAAESGDTAEDQTEDGTVPEDGENPESTDSASLEEVISVADGMSDEDAVAWYMEKHPDLKGVFGTNDAATQIAVEALSRTEFSDDVRVMGFDAGSSQISALESGDIDGLIVQNPFGMGYAAVVAASRTVLEIGNEAVVNTGYVWVDSENMEDEAVQPFLYD